MTTPQTAIIMVIEKLAATFECVTFGGKPSPEVRWYIDNGLPGNEDDQLLNESTDTISTIDGLSITTSRLVYSPDKSNQDQRIFCVANNTAVLFLSELKPQLNVQCKYRKQCLFYITCFLPFYQISTCN